MDLWLKILTKIWVKVAEIFKIVRNRYSIQIQHPKVSIKRYIIWHIEKVGFQPRKWLSVKIWPLKIFFSSKSTFFTLFSRIEWFGTKKNQKKFSIFFDFFEFFLSVKIWLLEIFFGQNSSKSTFFTLFSRIEWFGTKEEKKIFWLDPRFFIFWSSSNTAKCPKSRFWEFSRTCGLFQRLEDV